MKSIILLLSFALLSSEVGAQVRQKTTTKKSASFRTRTTKPATTAPVRKSRYVPEDSSLTERGSGYNGVQGLSPRTERADPARQAEQRANTTDPDNRNSLDGR